MGQAHPRAIQLDAASEGADPTLSHPPSASCFSAPLPSATAPLPSASPLQSTSPLHSTPLHSISPLHSTPLQSTSSPMHAIPTDQTFSRIDYTPGGTVPTRPTPSRSRGRGLVTKLSFRSHTPRTDQAKRRLDVDPALEAFEQLVLEKEARAGIASIPQPSLCAHLTSKTAKARTFAASRAKRGSIAAGSTSPSVPAFAHTSTPQSISFPTATPLALQSAVDADLALHAGLGEDGSRVIRRDSGRVSVKSSRRAEREWRAKVAAMGQSQSPNSSRGRNSSLGHHGPVRGPVPPRRRQPVRQATLSPDTSPVSPASEYILTPHVSPTTSASTPTGTATPSTLGADGAPDAGGEETGPCSSKLRISHLSFETLGHYHSTSTSFEAVGHHTTPTRLETLGHHTTPTRLEASVHQTTPTRLDDGPRNRKPSVPLSVSSFCPDSLHSAGGTRPSSRATSFTLATIPQENTRLPSRSDLHLGSEASQWHFPDESPPPRRLSLPPFDSFLASPTHVGGTPRTTPTSSPALRPADQKQSTSSATQPSPRARQRPSVEPIRVPARESTPIKAGARGPPQTTTSTPTRAPYSPMTAYLLTAPIEKLILDDMGCGGGPERGDGEDGEERQCGSKQHPFAMSALAVHETPVQTPPRASVVAQRYDTPSANLACPTPLADPFTAPATPLEPSGISAAREMVTIVPAQPNGVPVALRAGRGTHATNKMTGADATKANRIPGMHGASGNKQHAIGSRAPRPTLDLTPGMESGNRPPKSGMGVVDLARWLQQTAV